MGDPASAGEAGPPTEAAREQDGVDDREIRATELEIIRKIGEGTTAVVYLGKLLGVTVAVKEIGALSDETDLATIQAVQRELRVLTNVSHPNIVRFVGLVTETFPLRLVLEYCAGGSLFELLHNSWQIAISWPQRLKILVGSASAEEYLHSFDPPIIHRDLKSLNLMLLHPVKDEYATPHIKLADFGFARIEERAMTQGVGTKHWMAPEVLKGTEYTTKADVFSFAMVAFEVAFRHVPFERLDAHQVARQTVAGIRPDFEEVAADEAPAGILDIIRECWHQEPERRPSFQEVRQKIELLADGGER
mmetsp:Transcript_142495/g.355164  ORF Transcript_142495/g.355164 Transcript_142495/m.355164 type:complete len:305 (+) Transcript_142495:57-971(+)